MEGCGSVLNGEVRDQVFVEVTESRAVGLKERFKEHG